MAICTAPFESESGPLVSTVISPEPLEPIYPPGVQPVAATRVNRRSIDRQAPVAEVAELPPPGADAEPARALAAPAHVHSARSFVMRQRAQRVTTDLDMPVPVPVVTAS